MQSLREYPIEININNKKYHCKEVPVENMSYSKLVSSDGFCMVLVCDNIDERWSMYCRNHNLRKQMILDSYLIQYVNSPQHIEDFPKNKTYHDKKTIENFENIMTKIMPHNYIEKYNLNIGGFRHLTIKAIPLNSKFYMTDEFNNKESIEIVDPHLYIDI
jgi:hypothetical protein